MGVLKTRRPNGSAGNPRRGLSASAQKALRRPFSVCVQRSAGEGEPLQAFQPEPSPGGLPADRRGDRKGVVLPPESELLGEP
jgi:hypothetical protein